METAIDSIKIVMCGGNSVGKTTLLRRLAGVPIQANYMQTTGINVANFSVTVNAPTPVRLSIVDIGGDLIYSRAVNAPYFENIFNNTDGVFIVVDATSLQSMKDSDHWLEFLSANLPQQHAIKFLLVHKADRPLETRVVTHRNLDLFVQHSDIRDWAYTVGHCALGDVEQSRGSIPKQAAIEDMLRRMLNAIMQRRKKNAYKLVQVPTDVRFDSWWVVEYSELACLQDLNI